MIKAGVVERDDFSLGHVYLSYSLDDADDAGRLAHMLRAEGIEVKFGALTEPGLDFEAKVARDRSKARAVIAIWSSNSVTSGRVRTDAHAGQEAGKLIAVCLDAAAPPVMASVTIDGSGADGVTDNAVISQIAAAIMHLPDVPDVNEPMASDARDQVGSKPSRRAGAYRMLVIACGVAVVAAAAAAVGLLYAQRPGAASSAVGSEAMAPAVLPGAAARTGGTAPSAAALEAAASWPSVPRNDPLAIRGFLLAYPDGAHVEEAQSLLGRLERTSWQAVLDAKDAGATLARLADFRIAFPDSSPADAERVAQEQASFIADVQQLLLAAGYAPGRANGVLSPATQAAAIRARRDLSLPAGALIDPELREALLAADKDRRPDTLTDRLTDGRPARAAPEPVAALRPRYGEAFRDCDQCPELVLLPPGRFRMGDTTGAAADDERPAHDVTIAYALAVGRFEVTFEEWDVCLAEGGCRHQAQSAGGRGRLPVVNVSPADAAEYLGWLGRKSGQAYRLLSEAEWEYAARAGTATAWSSGNQPAALCAHGNGADASSDYEWNNVCDDGFATAAPVGRFRPNSFGLYDMIGNVWEWTADCWHRSYGGAPADGRAWTAGCHADANVLRGGAYSVDVDKLRASYRYHFAPRRMPFFGFRVARRLD